MIGNSGFGSKFSGGHSAVRRTTFVRQTPMSGGRGQGLDEKSVGKTHGVRELDHRDCYGPCR